MMLYLNLALFTGLSWWLLFKDDAARRSWGGWLFVLSLLFYVLSYVLAYQTWSWWRLVDWGFIFAGAWLVNACSARLWLGLTTLGLGNLGLWYHALTVGTVPSAYVWERLAKQGELIVAYASDTKEGDLRALLGGDLLSVEPLLEGQSKLLANYYVLDIKDDSRSDLGNIVRKLENSGLVSYWEGNETWAVWPKKQRSSKKLGPFLPVDFQPNDPYYGAQAWVFEQLDLGDWYSFYTQYKPRPQKRVRLFILDTGIDAKHEDLSANYQSYDLDSDWDEQGHGTHCAGIAGAVSNNGKGIASAFPTGDLLRITSLRVFDERGFTTQIRVIRAMVKAVEAGADVISLSLGGPSSDGGQAVYQEIMTFCQAKNVWVVAAAGNEGLGAKDYLPASAEGLVAVTALAEGGQGAEFSNTIEGLTMPLAAPGVGIVSTLPNGEYDAWSGTSMATPYVAAALCLIRAYGPQDWTIREAYKLLYETRRSYDQEAKYGPALQIGAAMSKILD